MSASVSHRLRELGIGLLILFVTLLIVWLVLEVFLRLTGIQEVVALNPRAFQKSNDPVLSYELIPSVHTSVFGADATVNALGFRSPPLDRSKPLIAMLGDSVTFGHGVRDSQTVAANLQRAFTGTFVLNAGVSGYNGAQEAEQYRTKIAALHPRLVILTFVFNDFDETLKLDPEGYFIPQSMNPATTYEQRLNASINGPGTFHFPGKLFLQMHSAVFNFLERMTKNLSFRMHRAAQNIFSDPVTPAQLASYRQTLDALSANLGQTPRIFVIWPENQLHLASRAALHAMAEADGWKLIDLYDIYGNTYPSLGWDSHPNAQTNARTAEVLTDAMRAWNMVPH